MEEYDKEKYMEDKSTEYLRGVTDCVDWIVEAFPEEVGTSKNYERLEKLRDTAHFFLVLRFAENFSVDRHLIEGKSAKKTVQPEA